MNEHDFKQLAQQAAVDHRRARQHTFHKFLKKRTAVVCALMLLIATLSALFAPLISPYPEQGRGELNLDERLNPISWSHPLGTDTLGRDMLSRIIYGARVSIFGGLIIVLSAAVIGIPLGLWAGYSEGIPGAIISRIGEILLSFPAILLAIGIATIVGAGLKSAVLALVIPWWPWYARVAQGEVLWIKRMLFIEAAQMLGYGKFYIIMRHLLPNIVNTLVVMMLLDFGPAIIAIGMLSFLGLGTQPPAADWGLMVWEGAPNLIDYWWVAMVPGSAMFILVIAFNIFGDALGELLGKRLQS